MSERLALLGQWQSAQCVSVRDSLCQLQQQAPAAAQRSITALSDGRQLHSGHAPRGLLSISPAARSSSCSGLTHLVWACALGNAVHYVGDDPTVQQGVAQLLKLLTASDSALSELLCVDGELPDHNTTDINLSDTELHVVVAPSADPAALVDDVMRASRVQPVALWVNHALHVEIQRRMPGISVLQSAEDLALPNERSGVSLLACGSVLETLLQLQGDSGRRTALYSGDWREVQHCCQGANARGGSFAVNSCDEPPLGLIQAQALYQMPSQTVIGRAD